MHLSTSLDCKKFKVSICTGTNSSDLLEQVLTTKKGLISEEAPLERLPCEYTDWEETAEILPKLISQILDGKASDDVSKSFNVRQLLEKLPTHEVNNLTTEKQQRRAILLLGIFAHTWVWLPYVSGMSDKPEYYIPKQIALPLHQLSEILGRPPVLTNSDLFDYNWKRNISNGEMNLNNTDILNGFIKNESEKSFYLIFLIMSVKGNSAIQAMLEIQKLLKSTGLIGELVLLEIKARLDIILLSLEEVKRTLSQVHLKIGKEDWFKQIRWFSVGWNNQDMFPNGVVYEGVKAYNNQGKFFYGPSGFQYLLLQCIDAFLDIRHEAYSNQVNARFYMPNNQVKIIEAIENSPKIRTLLTEHRIGDRKFFINTSNKNYQTIIATYNICVRQVKSIRGIHFGIASKYLTQMILKELDDKIILTTGGEQDNHEHLLKEIISYHNNQII